MNPDPASLDNLRPLIAPPPPPWWPPAPGWWFLLAALLAAAVCAAVRVWRLRRANAYRRAALRELAAAGSPEAIAEILKRAALCAYPRRQVASLSGAAWAQWLAETGRVEVSAAIGQSLSRGIFDEAQPADIVELRDFASRWIEDHQPRPTESRRGEAASGCSLAQGRAEEA